MANNKKQQKQVVDSIETLRHMPGELTNTLRHDFAEAGAKDFLAQLFGTSEKHDSKDSHGQTMKPGQEYNLKAQKQEKDKKEHAPRRAEAAIDYHRDIVRSSERLNAGEKQEMRYRVQEIMQELQRLVASSNALKAEFKDVSTTQAPKDAGRYHLNFFDWMLATIRQARMKVEDSGAWLSAVNTKKGKKGYWGMAKKHGTSFSMSNERNVATQTG